MDWLLIVAAATAGFFCFIWLGIGLLIMWLEVKDSRR
jgi:hypothetical protein